MKYFSYNKRHILAFISPPTMQKGSLLLFVASLGEFNTVRTKSSSTTILKVTDKPSCNHFCSKINNLKEIDNKKLCTRQEQSLSFDLSKAFD